MKPEIRKEMIFLQLVISLALCILGCDNQHPEIVTPPDVNEVPKTEISILVFKASSSSDHEMIQKTIDYAVQKKIPTVFIPDGEYKIETVAGNTPKGIELRDNIHLKLDDNAVLKAIPNGSSRYSILSVKNVSKVTISGGKIIGDSKEHTGTGGEWGMGIDIVDARSVEIRDIQIENCWGDGIYVGGNRPSTNILVNRVHCRSNRRQGISVVNCNGMIIKNSIFALTKGTAPQAGIDLEPNKGQTVSNIKIDSCSFKENVGPGFFIYAAAGYVSDIELMHSDFENNAQAGINLSGGKPMNANMKNLKKVVVSDIKAYNNSYVGLAIHDADDITINNSAITNSPKNAVSVENSIHIKLNQLKINDFTDYGVNVKNVDELKLLSGEVVTKKASARCIQLENSKNIEIKSAHIEGGELGVYAKTISNIMAGSLKLNNHSTHSMKIENNNSGSVKNSTFQHFGKESILMSNAKEIVIFNNTFSNNNGGSTPVNAYVSFVDSSTNNKFEGNTILKGDSHKVPLYGVYLGKMTSQNSTANNNIASDSYSVVNIKDEGSNNE